MTTDPRFLPPTPFARLVRTHAASACADACFAVSLAGSIFFQQPADSARGDILLYLLLTMAPFAIVAPVIGPALDRIRGGRRLLLVAATIGRGLLCLALMFYISDPPPAGLLVYPLAFSVLVFQRSYSVARSALVPALVEDETELVRANSRLAVISLVAGLAGGAPAFGIQELFGPEWSLAISAAIYGLAAVLGLRIPRTRMALDAQEQQLERAEIYQPSILLAGSTMAVLRSAVGFMVFFTAFAFKEDVALLALIGGAAWSGGLLGNVTAPVLRRRVREEVILVSALLTAAVLVLVGAVTGGTIGFMLAGLFVGVGASGGRLGFDSLLQRDGPDAVRGRAFAWFETRFQLGWVLGALVGLIPVDESAGLIGLSVVLGSAGLSYLAALRAARTSPPRTKLRPEAVDRAIGRARAEIRHRRHRRRSDSDPPG